MPRPKKTVDPVDTITEMAAELTAHKRFAEIVVEAAIECGITKRVGRPPSASASASTKPRRRRRTKAEMAIAAEVTGV